MFNRNKLVRIGPFECLDFPGEIDAPCIVLFHGYGADAGDLASMKSELEVGSDWRWVFPNGPLSVPIGPGFYGRAWMQLPQEVLESMFSGKGYDFSRSRPPGMDERVNQALQMIEALDVPAEKLILGGFSQGSMLAVEVAASMEKAPAGVVVLSGSAIDVASLTGKGRKHKALSFFQSHGTEDTVLPVAGAQKLEGVLTGMGWKGKLLKFSGGHEIPQVVLSSLDQFLEVLDKRIKN